MTPLPTGYRLSDRVTRSDALHHLAPRSGPAVRHRLAETSLYRPDLDLCATDAAGEVAAYGLFWFDPVTGVGLVEPMRTEQGHEGRGLARHVLTEGLRRLATHGAHRLKVNYETENERARRLYVGAGFAPTTPSTLYSRSLEPS